MAQIYIIGVVVCFCLYVLFVATAHSARVIDMSSDVDGIAIMVLGCFGILFWPLTLTVLFFVLLGTIIGRKLKK